MGRDKTPMRLVRIDLQLQTDATGQQTAEVYRAVRKVIDRPLGKFQASRFFSFPQ